MSDTKINPETGTIYSRAELLEAFNSVCDEQEWKNPIVNRTIPTTAENVVREAIIFYMACVPTFTEVTVPSGSFLLVNAIGYTAW